MVEWPGGPGGPGGPDGPGGQSGQGSLAQMICIQEIFGFCGLNHQIIIGSLGLDSHGIYMPLTGQSPHADRVVLLKM